MKKCPFCDWENEDDASKCLACGCELSTAITNNVEIKGGDNGEESGAYSVTITRVGGNKIAVIKVIKEYLNCGLAEAKEKCEKGYVTGNLTKANADSLIAQLRSVGAEAEAVAGEIDPSSESRPIDQNGFANKADGSDMKKFIITFLIAMGIMMLVVFLFVLR
ncbi:MAG: ribosomal protein L7/L12 [Clostridia bacterium]|nr:ribosomal protein L7/L12 [Clostridia bacterium]